MTAPAVSVVTVERPGDSRWPDAGGSGAGHRVPDDEIFAPVPDFPGYFVGDRGTVLSTKRSQLRELRGQIKSNGYVSVNLSAPGFVRKTLTVHPLVAHAFIGPRPDGHVVCHWDGTTVNNDVRNLRWGTPSENTQDAIRHGTVKPKPPQLQAGSRHPRFWTHCKYGHEFTPENTIRRPQGWRRCRTCEARRPRGKASS